MSELTESFVNPRHRAGRYQNQLAGYRAFVPAPLPPHPPIRMVGEIQSLLSYADRALGRLDIFRCDATEAEGQELNATALTAANNLIARVFRYATLPSLVTTRRTTRRKQKESRHD